MALANVLWWLDSRAEPEPRPPTAAADGHPLVTSYPVFGRAPDDHDAANVGPLVEELAALSAPGDVVLVLGAGDVARVGDELLDTLERREQLRGGGKG